MKVTISFTLDDRVDHDLLRWLDQFGQRNRSRAIRDGLRDHINQNGVTLTDLYQVAEETRALVAALRQAGGPVAAAETTEDEAVPADIVASLSRLGL